MSKAMEIFNEFRKLFGNYLINNVAEKEFILTKEMKVYSRKIRDLELKEKNTYLMELVVKDENSLIPIDDDFRMNMLKFEKMLMEEFCINQYFFSAEAALKNSSSKKYNIFGFFTSDMNIVFYPEIKEFILNKYDKDNMLDHSSFVLLSFGKV